MKSILFALAVIVSITTAKPAHALIQAAATVRVLASTANVSYTAWSTAFASPIKAIQGISVVNTTLNPVQIGIGAVGSEAVQMTVPSAFTQAGLQSAAQPQIFPLSLGQNQRIAYRGLNSTATSGELQINVFYN